MELFDIIRGFLFLFVIVVLLWFASTDTFRGIWEKNTFNLGMILMWVCLGAAVAWLIIAFVRPENRQLAFYSFQTILQTIGIIIILIAILSPWGFVYDEFANYYAKNVCFPSNSSFDIYPLGRSAGVLMYEKGSMFNPYGTNATWQSAIPRAKCSYENSKECINLTQNMNKKFIDYQN
jgi:hypothetical protein